MSGRAATIASQGKSFGGCMSCRAPFRPIKYCMGTTESELLMRLCEPFTKHKPPSEFMEPKRDGHVTQVKVVQPALRWWDEQLDKMLKIRKYEAWVEQLQAGVNRPKTGLGRLVGIDPLPPFPCPATDTGKKVAPDTIATWKAPAEKITFPVLQGLFKDPHSGRAVIPPGTRGEMDNTTFPVCARCNAIMDSDSAQRSLLYTDAGGLIPDDCIELSNSVTGAVIGTIPSVTKQDVCSSHRHALLVYYIHMCLLGLDKGTYTILKQRGGFQLYTRLCYLFLMVGAKRKALATACQDGLVDCHPRGQLEFYVSYLSWVLLTHCYDGGRQQFDFYVYHLFYASEAPMCKCLWPPNCPRSLGRYIFTSMITNATPTESLLDVDKGVCAFVAKIGAYLKCIQCGNDAVLGRLRVNTKQTKETNDILALARRYFVNDKEADRLMDLETMSCAGVTKANDQDPGRVIQCFGCVPLLLPFYNNLWVQRDLRAATWDTMQKIVVIEWTNMCRENPGWLPSDPSGREGIVKVAYNLAFCADLNVKAEEARGKHTRVTSLVASDDSDADASSSADDSSSAGTGAATPPGVDTDDDDAPAYNTRSRRRTVPVPPPAPSSPPPPPPGVNPRQDASDVEYLIRKYTANSLIKFMKTTPLCSVWKTSLRLMSLRACTYVSEVDGGGVAYIPDLYK